MVRIMFETNAGVAGSVVILVVAGFFVATILFKLARFVWRRRRMAKREAAAFRDHVRRVGERQ
jgi:hypothetical protein